LSAPPFSSNLVLDIETVPDTELYAPPDLPPGVERPFPPLWACRPVTIGLLWLDERMTCRRLTTLGDGQDEAAMLTELSALMGEWRPRLVTWNGRTFDLPLLALRALRHGVPFPWYYQDPETRSRYSPQGHLDLADFLADHGAARMTSLDAAARLIGLPGKNGIDGSQVEGLYLRGEIQAVRDYCLSDVAQTAFVFLRHRLLTGQIERPAYREAAAALLAVLEADPRLARLTAAIDRPRLLL
jgi:predicted PolB exonuclease-like 3'-5' exonuclease